MLTSCRSHNLKKFSCRLTSKILLQSLKFASKTVGLIDMLSVHCGVFNQSLVRVLLGPLTYASISICDKTTSHPPSCINERKMVSINGNRTGETENETLCQKSEKVPLKSGTLYKTVTLIQSYILTHCVTTLSNICLGFLIEILPQKSDKFLKMFS